MTYERHALLYLIEQCLIRQDFPLQDVEWIILDDSPEKPTGLSFNWAQNAGIEVIYVPIDQKLKLGAKRNLSHQYCRGEFIVYMDDDDYYPPSRLSHAIERLETSACLVAGCSELPLLLLPECSTWMTHSFGPNHATGNTLAFQRNYLEHHAYDPDATEAEESVFLDGFKAAMVQLDPRKTITCIGHSRNTVDKRRFITANQGTGISRIHAPQGEFVPVDHLENYRRALGEIEFIHKQGIRLSGSRSDQVASQSAGSGSDEIPRIAVITPYYREPLEILKRCHDSVLSQTIACTHFLIADGPGLDALDAWQCRHIRLGGSGHSDNGNTPRAIGSLCAMNEGFTCIAYLDADNWYLPDHLLSAIKTQQQEECEVVFTGREICFPDGELLPQLDEEDLSHSHADTSCFVIFEKAFKSLAIWAQMPKELGPFCDRVAFNYLTSHFNCAWTDRPSVIFETWYWGHFSAAGKLPPANAKFLTARPASDWKRVGQNFRERSHTPFMPTALPESPEKVRINLISVLGPPGCGAHRIQRDLCRHITFFGIPPNDFLFQWQKVWGLDFETRHDSSLILHKLSTVGNTLDSVADWPCTGAADFANALPTTGTFNALEAYFRVVQKSMPARSREFSRLNGLSNVIERSSSAAFASQLLFEMLPMHRALLVVGDPIVQIGRMLRYRTTHFQAKCSDKQQLYLLCQQYLEALICPLEAAPGEQLMIIHTATYLLSPQTSLRSIAAWFDIQTEEWPDGALRHTDTHGTHNSIYQKELDQLETCIDEEIHLHQSTSGINFPFADIDHAIELAAEDNTTRQLSGIEEESLRALFSPLIALMTSYTTDSGTMEWRVNPHSATKKMPVTSTDDSIDQLHVRVDKLTELLHVRLREKTMAHIWPDHAPGDLGDSP